MKKIDLVMYLFNPNISKLLIVSSTIHNFTTKWLCSMGQVSSDFKNWTIISKYLIRVMTYYHSRKIMTLV